MGMDAKIKQTISTILRQLSFSFSELGRKPQSVSPQVRLQNGKRSVWSCTFCGKYYPSKSHLQQHQRIHTGEKPYPCLYCQMAFSQSGTRKRHIANKHQKLLIGHVVQNLDESD